MNIHQYIASGAWILVLLGFVLFAFSGLVQLTGLRAWELLLAIVVTLTMKVGPFVLIGYTIYAFFIA